MTINYQIRHKKLQYDINREAAKISALSSDKIDKYEYVTGEEILPSNQQQIIGQAKFTYSALGKAFEKQIKIIEDQGQKQFEALKSLKSDNKKLTIEEVISESALIMKKLKKTLIKVKKQKKLQTEKKLIYKGNEKFYCVKNFQTIKTFGRDIYEVKITLKEVDEDQINLLTSEPHVLILKLPDKLDLRRGEEIIALSDLSIYYTWKNI